MFRKYYYKNVHSRLKQHLKSNSLYHKQFDLRKDNSIEHAYVGSYRSWESFNGDEYTIGLFVHLSKDHQILL